MQMQNATVTNSKRFISWECLKGILLLVFTWRDVTWQLKINLFTSFHLGSTLCVQNTASWIFEISTVRDLKTAPWQSCLVWKNGLFFRFLAVWTVKTLGEVFLCMHTSSWGKSNCCHSKSEFQMFSLISSRHVGAPQSGAYMASPHWAL